MHFISYEQKLFLKNFIQKPNMVGSILPSSKYLTSSMLKNIDFASCKSIVEYGAGTGVFTKEIIGRKNKDTMFISFELNKSLFNQLRSFHAPNQNIYIINDSVDNIMGHLIDHNIKGIDYIVSGLPFAVLPRDLTLRILDSTFETLGENGEFVTFQYSLQLFDTLKHFFPQVSLGYQLFNIPPAFVYHCRK